MSGRNSPVRHGRHHAQEQQDQQEGDEHQHELGIRWVHVSNGGLKEPNPGQDFLQLRYVSRF